MKKSGKFTIRKLVTALTAVAAITTLSFASSAVPLKSWKKKT